MAVLFTLSVYERRNPKNQIELIYLVGRGKGASAHSKLDWALDALVEEMKRLTKSRVVFDEQAQIVYDRPYDEEGGYGLNYHRPFTPEERQQIWQGIHRRLRKD